MTELGRGDIRGLLEACEREFMLPAGTLVNIYNAEARVVFMGKRRNVFKDLRETVHQVADIVGSAANDNLQA